jgi:hypothetical protein
VNNPWQRFACSETFSIFVFEVEQIVHTCLSLKGVVLVEEFRSSFGHLCLRHPARVARSFRVFVQVRVLGEEERKIKSGSVWCRRR